MVSTTPGALDPLAAQLLEEAEAEVEAEAEAEPSTAAEGVGVFPSELSFEPI